MAHRMRVRSKVNYGVVSMEVRSVFFLRAVAPSRLDPWC